MANAKTKNKSSPLQKNSNIDQVHLSPKMVVLIERNFIGENDVNDIITNFVLKQLCSNKYIL